jgi:hypothetical protein
MSFYSDQAAQFQQLASNIQTRIDKAGATMDQGTRTTLGTQQDALLDQADAMIAADVQVALEGLNLDQPRLAACTASLNGAAQVVKRFNSIVAIGEAGLTLVTACVSGNPASIVSAIAGAEKAVSDALKSNAAATPTPGAGSQTGGDIAEIPASGDSADSGQ